MVSGILTRKGKVVYRTHRAKRDRVRHNFYLADVLRIWRQVAPRLDSTYFLSDNQIDKGAPNLDMLFDIFEITSDVLYMVFLDANPGIRIRMIARLAEGNIARKILGLETGGDDAS